jgi:hypothetical protein
MPVEITQERLMQALSQQAICWFGEEQAEHLRAQLEERAVHLWLIARHPPGLEEEPDFVCTITRRFQER